MSFAGMATSGSWTRKWRSRRARFIRHRRTIENLSPQISSSSETGTRGTSGTGRCRKKSGKPSFLGRPLLDDLGGNIHAFLAESVVATIEVKSLLTREDLETAILSAGRAKTLQRNLITAFMSGYVPPGILSFVVAYDGPAQIATVRNWVRSIEKDHGLNTSELPRTRQERMTVLSQSIAGVGACFSTMLQSH
jgi:hypothetical protein